jgi:zinc protease
MKKMSTFRLQLLIIIVLSGLFASLSPVRAELIDLSGMSTLKNGFDVRLMPETSTPVVAALVLVRTGYASETASKSGFSHLLEHLVFAGTEGRTKDSIQREVKDLGGYINGFTRDDYTGYLIVGHRDHLDQLLDILADILFNSTIKEQAVVEAKEVVLEEIRRSQSRPGTKEEELFQSLLYEGSSYAATGLGNETTVRAAGRDEIADFYRRTYRPNNMILLLKGGFDPAAAMDAVRGSFGGEDMVGESPDVVPPAPPLAERTYLLTSAMPDVRVRIGFAGPDPRGSDAQALELLAAVLGGREGILDRALKGAGMQPRSVSAALSINADFSRFVVSAVLPSGSDPAAAQMVLLEAIPSALTLDDFASQVTQTRESLVAGEVLGKEKLHYYLMGKAPWVVAGSPGQGFSSGRWDDLTQKDLADAARKYLVNAPYAALLTIPESMRSDYSGPKGPVRAEAMLDNGLRVVAEQRPGSPVFALHIMTRHRLAVEPEGKTGITDFLHRLLPLGTYNRSREDIESTLRKFGISLSTAGNPMVPFGDFYTSRLYSHIRLECVDDKARNAVTLLSDMMTNPLLEEGTIEEVRSRILDYITYIGASPGTLASGTLAQRLYAPVLAADVYGTESSISGILREDLLEFHRRYFTGQNLIISVVSGMPPEEAIALVEELFNELPAGDRADVPPVPLTTASQVVEKELGKPQGALAVGAVTGDMDRADAPALAIASRLLNTRLYEELREKEGLAYSLGASMGDVGGRAVFTLSVGTAPDKLQQARESVRKQIEAARNASVTKRDLEREINGLVGRLQMRMLSSINRAYYLGIATRQSLTHTFGEDYRELLLALSPGDIEQATRKYLPAGNLVEVVIR